MSSDQTITEPTDAERADALAAACDYAIKQGVVWLRAWRAGDPKARADLERWRMGGEMARFDLADVQAMLRENERALDEIQSLRALVMRLTDVAANLASELPDPGAEALAAIHCGRHLIYG